MERQIGGHRILTHRAPKEVIGYQAHDGQDVKMQIKKQILENAQRHMDILCDHIFKFSTYKWSTALITMQLFKTTRRTSNLLREDLRDCKAIS